MEAISADKIWLLLLSACPEFTPEYDNFDDDDRELPYIGIMTFTHFLLNQNLPALYSRVAHAIEELIINGDHYVSEFAVIGILEGMLYWPESLYYEQSTAFSEHLEPISALYWNSLKKFWSGEIPYVGADIPRAQLDLKQ